MQAEHYLQGLLQASRKNMERMEEVVPDCDYQSLQHFLSHSGWDVRAILDQVAAEVDRRDVTVDEVVRQMEARHKARQAAIDSAYRRQRLASAGRR